MLFNELSNEKILEMGNDFNVCGTESCILWDGDLEEFLNNHNFKFLQNYPIKEVLIGENSEIINCKMGELIGYQGFEHGENQFFVPIIVDKEAASEMNEQFDFNNILNVSDVEIILNLSKAFNSFNSRFDSIAFDRHFGDNYPFGKISFDELTVNIEAWLEDFDKLKL